MEGTDMSGFYFNENPTDATPQTDNQANPLEKPIIENTPDAQAVYNAATDVGNKTQVDLNNAGYSGRVNLNEDSLNRAQSGEDYNKNMQYGSTNIPVEGPFANYNNMSWDQTQRLSRLADAFNASHRWTPGKVGIDAAGTNIPQYVRQDPIQTEEMRRGDLTRQGLGQQQSLALNRANEILKHPQDLINMLDSKGIEANAAQLEIARNFADYTQRAQYDAEFKQRFEQALQKDMLNYTQALSYYWKSEVATILYNQLLTNSTFAQYMISNLTNTVGPNQTQLLASQLADQIIASGITQNKNKQSIYLELQKILADITGAQAAIDTTTGNYVAGQSYGNFGKGWFGGGVTK